MKKTTCAASVFCALAAGGAFAQSPPGAIPVGPMFAYPEVTATVRRDSNFALQTDANRRSDTIWIIQPSIRLEAKQGANTYNVGYRTEFGRFNESTADDFE